MSGPSFTVFLPGKLMNLKGNRAHWSSAIWYKRTWRRKVWLEMRNYRLPVATVPKRITVAANVWNLFDEIDGLRAACSPIIDGLRDGGLIHNDDPGCGHEFGYSQEVNRAALG